MNNIGKAVGTVAVAGMVVGVAAFAPSAVAGALVVAGIACMCIW